MSGLNCPICGLDGFHTWSEIERHIQAYLKTFGKYCDQVRVGANTRK